MFWKPRQEPEDGRSHGINITKRSPKGKPEKWPLTDDDKVKLEVTTRQGPWRCGRPRLSWPVELVLPSSSHLSSSCQGGDCLDSGRWGDCLASAGGGSRRGTNPCHHPPHMSELNLRLRGRCVMSLYSHLSKRCYFTYLAGQPGKVAAPHLQGRPGVSTATSGEQCVLWQALGEWEVCWRGALHLETA